MHRRGGPAFAQVGRRSVSGWKAAACVNARTHAEPSQTDPSLYAPVCYSSSRSAVPLVCSFGVRSARPRVPRRHALSPEPRSGVPLHPLLGYSSSFPKRWSVVRHPVIGASPTISVFVLVRVMWTTDLNLITARRAAHAECIRTALRDQGVNFLLQVPGVVSRTFPAGRRQCVRKRCLAIRYLHTILSVVHCPTARLIDLHA